MSSAFFFLLPIIIFVFFSLMGFIISAASRSSRVRSAVLLNNKKRKTVSDDGHYVPRSDDLTCETAQGHRHNRNNEFGDRYIVHNEPEEGYVVLNGIIRKIEDCKNL